MKKEEKIEGEEYKETYGNRIEIGDANVDGKRTIYFKTIVDDKKESVFVVVPSYADAMRFAMSLMVKIMEHLLESKERSKKSKKK